MIEFKKRRIHKAWVQSFREDRRVVIQGVALEG
jgi:hypothetical protein